MSDNRNKQVPVIHPGRPGGGPPGGHMRMPAEKPKDTKGTVKRLLQYIGTSKYLFFSLLGVVLFVTLLTLAGPSIQASAIDAITLREGQLHVDFDKLFTMLALLGGVYLLQSLANYLQGIFAAKLSLNTVKKMRSDLFGKMEHLPISYFDTHRHGDIMSRMTNDVENVSNSISQSIASLISGILTIAGVLTIMLIYSPVLTLVSVATIPLSMLATIKIAQISRKYFTRQQTLLGILDGQAEEMISGYKTVVAFSREKKAVAEFAEVSEKLRGCGIKAQIFGGIMGPVMNVIGNLGYLLIAAAGGYMALQGMITIGVIQAFLQYSKQFTRPINEIANQYAQIQTALAGAERVFEIMDYPPEENQGQNMLKSTKGNICFKDVHFAYKKDEPVLRGLDLDIKAGQRIAIVGATGSGKTTIVNLLLRFYDIDSGSITVDGTDIREVDKASLRRNIAIVLQDTVLFSDTVAKNISYGRDGATDEEIRLAAAAANADRFVELLPESYDTVLSESGANLSRGQRQLLSIARAVLADPKVLILDEATSSVDTRTEMQIGLAMNTLMKNRTSLIIAHRLSTIRDADKIVVIDKGRVAEMGNHEELLNLKGCYYNLYQSQFAGLAT